MAVILNRCRGGFVKTELLRQRRVGGVHRYLDGMICNSEYEWQETGWPLYYIRLIRTQSPRILDPARWGAESRMIHLSDVQQSSVRILIRLQLQLLFHWQPWAISIVLQSRSQYSRRLQLGVPWISINDGKENHGFTWFGRLSGWTWSSSTVELLRRSGTMRTLKTLSFCSRTEP